jgi:putative transposase
MTNMRRMNICGAAYFLTTNIRDNRFPYRDSGHAEAAIQIIYRYREQRDYDLLGFVIMPDHWHLLIAPKKGLSVSSIMNRLKTAEAKRLIAAGWQPPIWWKRFYDRVIRNQDMLCATLSYLHENPVKKGLTRKAADYPFSSANARWETDLNKYL